MPLSAPKRQEILDMLKPIVNDAVSAGLNSTVEAAVKEEIRKATVEVRDDDDSYASKILSGSSRRRSAAEQEGAKGMAVARIGSCLALAKGNVDAAIVLAKKRYTDDLGDLVVKTMQSGTENEGGVFVPSVLASEYIDALRPRAAVRRAGPRMIDLTGGNLTVPRIATDATAGYVGEVQKRNASNPKTGGLNFVARKLVAKAPISLDLLRRSSQNADAMMRDNLLKASANVEDQAFLAGSGAAATPRGMLNWAKSGNFFAATQAGADATLTEVSGDLRDVISMLTNADVDMTRATWFMHNRSNNYLAFDIRTTTGDYVFKAELTAARPMLHGFAVEKTNNIPMNLGSGTNESRLYLTNMDDAWLAEETGIIIRASSEASFADENGTLVSAFDLGLMVVLIERNHDFAMAHPESVAGLTTLKWGA